MFYGLERDQVLAPQISDRIPCWQRRATVRLRMLHAWPCKQQW